VTFKFDQALDAVLIRPIAVDLHEDSFRNSSGKRITLLLANVRSPITL